MRIAALWKSLVANQRGGNFMDRNLGKFSTICVTLFAMQSIFRIFALKYLYNFGIGSSIIHACTIFILVSVVYVFIRNYNSTIALAISSAIMAMFILISTIFDINAIYSRSIFNFPLSFQEMAIFYCNEDHWYTCFGKYKNILYLIIMIYLLIMLASFIILKKLINFEIVSQLKLLSYSNIINNLFKIIFAVFCISYILFFAYYPKYLNREPVSYQFMETYFKAGPKELLSIRREKFTITPSVRLRPRTLVLITVDSLRPDFVGLNDDQATLTPFLRSLADSGHLKNVGPATSICTLSYCGILGIQSSSTWAKLQHGPPLTLADVLAANGYRNHFLLSGPHLRFGRLGDNYGAATTILDDSSPDSHTMADDREQVRRLERLAIVDPSRTFIAIHLMSAHAFGHRFMSSKPASAKWRVPDNDDPLFLASYREYYSNGVRQADAVIGQLFAVLERKALLADALVVITADHGERITIPAGMNPHGGVPDRASATIPVLVYESKPMDWPIHDNVSQVDIAPTLLDAVGIQVPDGWSGYSLKRPDVHPAVAVDSYEAAGMVAIVSGRKLLFHCNVRSGETAVSPLAGPALSASETAGAMARAPALYATLPRRRDALRCFSPPVAAPLRS